MIYSLDEFKKRIAPIAEKYEISIHKTPLFYENLQKEKVKIYG